MKNQINILIITVLVLFAALACSSKQTKNTVQKNASTNNAVSEDSLSNSSLSADEKAYISKAGGYMKSLFEQDERITATAIDVGARKATLGQMQQVIERAKTVENAGFFGDYGSPKPPRGYETIDANVQKIHKMHVAVFKEYLAYWDDKNVEHINSASAVLKNAVKLLGENIKLLTEEMKSKTIVK